VQWEFPFRASLYVDEMQNLVGPTPPGKPDDGSGASNHPLSWKDIKEFIDSAGAPPSSATIAWHGMLCSYRSKRLSRQSISIPLSNSSVDVSTW
jgi:hypothetical protein